MARSGWRIKVGVYRKEHEICATFCAIFIHRLLGFSSRMFFSRCTIAVNTPHCNAVSLFSNFTFLFFFLARSNDFTFLSLFFIILSFSFTSSGIFFFIIHELAIVSVGCQFFFLIFYLRFLSFLPFKLSLEPEEEKLFYWFLGKFPSPISQWFRWLPLSVIFYPALVPFHSIYALEKRFFRLVQRNLLLEVAKLPREALQWNQTLHVTDATSL